MEKFDKVNTLNLILKEEYGILPSDCFLPLTYEIDVDKYVNNIHIKKVYMCYKDYKMRLYLYIPIDKVKCKTFIFVMHGYAERTANKDFINQYQSFAHYCPIDYIVSRGYAVAILAANDIAPDKNEEERKTIFDYIPNKENDSWGTLQAWSWGCRKALDYLYTMPNEIDLNNVCIIGHSRGGKVALITAAQDERFIMAVSSCSGNSGAALARNNSGERIKDILGGFPNWFCRNYFKYIDNEDKLPFDQHQLIGCIAPRYVYCLSATEDSWACPKNELLSCKMASKYFEEYNIKGLIVEKNIKTDVSYQEGHIGYHIKTGKHCIELRDWKMIIDYFEKHRR